jgi:hypothetical protein
MIFIFAFLKHEKYANLFFVFIKNMLRKLLGFDCMHENKIFLFFVCFFKDINLEFFEFFYKTFWRKLGIFIPDLK